MEGKKGKPLAALNGLSRGRNYNKIMQVHLCSVNSTFKKYVKIEEMW